MSDTPAPRHGRHAAPRTSVPPASERAAHEGEHVSAHATGARRSPEALARLRELPVIDPGDADSSEQGAPSPIGVDPAATGAFRRIDEADAARLTTRDNVRDMADATGRIYVGDVLAEQRRIADHARPKVSPRERAPRRKMSRGIVALIVIAVAAVLALGFHFVRAAMNSATSSGGEHAETSQVEPDGSLEYRGTIYAIRQQDDGSYALTGTPAEGGDTTQLFSFTGTPVMLAMYNGAAIVPENNSDGTWDVLAYTIGSGSVATQMMNTDGTPVTGEGSLSAATLDGANLVLTDAQGNQTTVPLS